MLNIESFINTFVIHRDESMFASDINNYTDELYKKIHNRSILVIGGAGSIGSAFISAILEYEPNELVVVDTSENALAELTRFLRSHSNLSKKIPKIYRSYPMDYSTATFKRMFCNYRCSNNAKGFDIVANFSAHKHVRSEKDIYSVEALLRNNVINVKGLLDLLVQYPPELYFCVSTDKAANPVNIMGASKRLMEDLIFSYSDCFPVKTARFANVAFSNGSLPAGFLERISKLQPISAPSDVKRYFVSPEESGQICMLSAILGKNREIFFPKLEETQMVSFDYIARELLHAYGYKVLECNSDEAAVKAAEELKDGSRQYPVHFSKSDTSGEKAYEEFFIKSEIVDNDRFQSLGVITDKPIPNRESLEQLIKQLCQAFDSEYATKEIVVEMIKRYLPNFKHIETGKSLDNKM